MVSLSLRRITPTAISIPEIFCTALRNTIVPSKLNAARTMNEMPTNGLVRMVMIAKIIHNGIYELRKRMNRESAFAMVEEWHRAGHSGRASACAHDQA